MAAWEGRTSLIEDLIQRGAKVDPVRCNGSTPLHLACWKGHAEAAKVWFDESRSLGWAIGREGGVVGPWWAGGKGGGWGSRDGISWLAQLCSTQRGPV